MRKQQHRPVVKYIQISLGCIALISLCVLFLCTNTAYGRENVQPTPESIQNLPSTFAYQVKLTSSRLTLTPTPSTPITISVSSPPDYVIYFLQAAYDVLTLFLVIVSFWSIRQSRKQSQTALNQSERQANNAITTVHDQIEASKQQATDAKYQQSKPILICKDMLKDLPYDENRIELLIENGGSGVATNIFGIFSLRQHKYIFEETGRIKSGSWEIPDQIFGKCIGYEIILHKFETAHFNILAPGIKEPFPFNRVGQDQLLRKLVTDESELNEEIPGLEAFDENSPDFKKIEGFNFIPPVKNELLYNVRLILTYLDIFNRKHLSIFDFHERWGWTQVALREGIDQTLDEVLR